MSDILMMIMRGVTALVSVWIWWMLIDLFRTGGRLAKQKDEQSGDGKPTSDGNHK